MKKMRWPGRRAWRRAAITVASIVGVYAVLVGLVAPPIARSVAEKKLTAAMHRRATIEKLVINPFTLALTVRGFALRDRDGGPFVAFDELYVNVQLMSIIRRGAVVREVTLLRPAITIVRETPQRYSFSDLLEGEPSPPPPPKQESSPTRYSINNIRILGGSVDFVDQPMHQTHTVRDLTVAVPFISNLPYDVESYVQPAFSASFDGTVLNLGGRTKPFSHDRETQIDLDVRELSLARYFEYVPVPLRFTLRSALLDAALTVQFAQRDAEKPTLTLSGRASLKKVALRDHAGEPLIELAQLAVVIAPSEPLAGRLTLERVQLDSPTVWVRRQRNGRMNLDDLAPAAPPPASAAPAAPTAKVDAAPFVVAVDSLGVAGGTVHFADAPPGGAFATTVSDLGIDVSHFSTARAATAAVEIRLRTDGGETLADKSELTLSPLHLKGHVQLAGVPLKRYAPYYRPALLVDIDQGSLDAAADYDVRAADGGPDIAIHDAAVSLSGLKARRRGERGELAAVGALAVRQVDVDLGKRTLQIGDVTTSAGSISIVRAHDGTLNLASLTPPPAPGASPAAAAPAAASARQAAPWTLGVKHLGVQQWTVRFEDRGPEDAVVMVTNLQSLSVADFSSVRGSRARVALRARINKGGTLSLGGTVVPDPFAAALRLDAKALDVVPLQPYLAERVNLLVTSGAVSFGGNLALAASARGSTAKYQGSVGIDKLTTMDADGEDTLVKWDSLYVAGIDAGNDPLGVKVGEVSLSGFYARLAVSADGQLNVKGVVATPAAAASDDKQVAVAAPPRSAAAAATAATPAASASASPRVPISIGKVTLQGGAIDYSDEYVHPSFSASLTEVGGRITGLSSSADSVADLDLRGKLGGVAPLEITGKVNPLAQKLALDLSVMFRDIELSNLSPYSGKYAGYTIAKGKLTLELKYSVQERKLVASNKVFLDQLTLGERVQNKTATRMPVKLALAVLRDSRGEIHLDLPISGSLDDPKFKVGRIIVQVLLNVLTKAVTEPFALLGALFGRGPELSYLEFSAGHDDVDAAMADKLKVLHKVLTSRPALKLEVTGHVGPDADREGLRRVVFERKVKAQKVKTLAKQGTAVSESVDDVKIAPDEYERYLRLAYKEEKFPKPRNAIGLVKDLPVGEVEKLMLTHITVDDDDLRLLAQRRAEAARRRLLSAGISPERIFVVEPKQLAAPKKDKARDTRVDFAIR